MISSYSRGHKIIFINNQWIYEDSGEPLQEGRECARCKCNPIEGYDACLGHIEGVVSACCGHGVEEPYLIKEKV